MGKDGKIAGDGAPSTKEILQTDGVKPVLVIYFYTFFLAFCYTARKLQKFPCSESPANGEAVTPVFQFTPIELGGYSFSPKQISYLLAVAGAGQAFWTLIIFPPLHARVGNKHIIQLCSAAWTISFALYPILNFALRRGIEQKAFWIIAFTLSAVFSGISISFTTVQLCLNDISPSPMALGTLNGVSVTANCPQIGS